MLEANAGFLHLVNGTGVLELTPSLEATERWSFLNLNITRPSQEGDYTGAQ